MPEAKTKATAASVADFLRAIPDAEVRKDCLTIVDMMQAATKAEAKMWGSGIVGFGEYSLVYADGREAPWPVIAFAPRKQTIVLYGMGGIAQGDALLAKLGKHERGKGCLYIKRLSDVDVPTLTKLVKASVQAKLTAGPRTRRKG